MNSVKINIQAPVIELQDKKNILKALLENVIFIYTHYESLENKTL